MNMCQKENQKLKTRYRCFSKLEFLCPYYQGSHSMQAVVGTNSIWSPTHWLRNCTGSGLPYLTKAAYKFNVSDEEPKSPKSIRQTKNLIHKPRRKLGWIVWYNDTISKIASSFRYMASSFLLEKVIWINNNWKNDYASDSQAIRGTPFQ